MSGRRKKTQEEVEGARVFALDAFALLTSEEKKVAWARYRQMRRSAQR